jgi:polyphosphate kinase
MLVPGIKGLSENIRVIAIIDQYLEHSRIISFGSGENASYYLSSADWMPRNLERRVELMFPVLDPDIKERLNKILDIYFRDNSQSWELQSDRIWHRRKAALDGKRYCAQDEFEERVKSGRSRDWEEGSGFIVRRSKQ